MFDPKTVWFTILGQKLTFLGQKHELVPFSRESKKMFFSFALSYFVGLKSTPWVHLIGLCIHVCLKLMGKYAKVLASHPLFHSTLVPLCNTMFCHPRTGV